MNDNQTVPDGEIQNAIDRLVKLKAPHLRYLASHPRDNGISRNHSEKNVASLDLAIAALRQFRKPTYSGTCGTCGGQLETDYVLCPYCGEFAKQPTCRAAKIPCELADDDGICKIPECIKPGKRPDLTGPKYGCDTCKHIKQPTSAEPCCLCKHASFAATASRWQPKGGDRT